MRIEILKHVELDGEMPVQRAYLHIDGTKLFGPLTETETDVLIGVLKKALVPYDFSEEAI